MSAAFTPGPWKLRIDPYEDDPFPGKDFFVLRLGDDAIQGITEPSNARLIRAAPELFDGLERAFIFICNNMPLGPTNDRTEAGKLIDSLRVPLADARGDTE